LVAQGKKEAAETLITTNVKGIFKRFEWLVSVSLIEGIHFIVDFPILFDTLKPSQ